MPEDVTLVPNPDWLRAQKRTQAEIDWFKGLKPVQCPPSVARDNLRLEPGLYMQKVTEELAGPAASAFDVDKMSVAQLKVLAAQVGVTIAPGMKRADVAAAVQAKLDETSIEDDASA